MASHWNLWTGEVEVRGDRGRVGLSFLSFSFDHHSIIAFTSIPHGITLGKAGPLAS